MNFLLALCLLSLGTANHKIEIRLRDWTAKIEPGTLTVRARVDGGSKNILIARGAAHPVSDLARTPGSAAWRIPDLGLTVRFTADGNRLHVRLESSRNTEIAWPRTGDDAQMSAMILPDGEGLYLPLADAAWRRRLAGQCDAVSGGLSMPFWSYQVGRRTFTYHVLSDIRSSLCFEDTQGRLTATLKHNFRVRDGAVPYELEIWPGGSSPIAPALEYREGLLRASRLVTLDEKTHKNPQVAKLLGAIHMYVWGDGRSPAFVDDLVKLGVKRAWIGYDQDEHIQHTHAGKDFVAAAEKAGYLVGPYDTFTNAQDPKAGDAASRWPGGLYKAGCIVGRKGQIVKGYAGRGCELSSEALERAEPTLKAMAARVEKRLKDGANSYFLDVDAYGELYDDFSPAHPMTPFKDRANRLQRLRRLRDRGLVLGSEEGVAWSVPVLDFAHGAFAVHNAALWKVLKTFGGWWPPDRPRIFFRPYEPSEEFREAKYDPAFRVPLYEAAFHDSIVSTDRWDVPMGKMPVLAGTRQLLELLCGVPSIWAMDRRELREERDVLTPLLKFFEPLHRRIGNLPLTSFQWLTSDRLVQRTRFGNTVELTANFGKSSFNRVRPDCIATHWLAEDRTETFCASSEGVPQVLLFLEP